MTKQTLKTFLEKALVFAGIILVVGLLWLAYGKVQDVLGANGGGSASRGDLSLSLDMGNNNGGATPVVYDTSGHNRHATSTAGATAPTCNNNFCDFDGNDDLMTSDSTNVFNSSEITYSIKFSPDNEAGSNGNEYFFDADATDANRTILFTSATGVLNIYFGATTEVATIAVATYAPHWRVGQENVIVVRSDSSGDTDVFLNGFAILENDSTTWTAQNPTELNISNRISQDTFSIDGKLHYFKVWQRLLTDDEVANLSADRTTKVGTANRTGLIGYWNFDNHDIHGTTLYDKSGQNYNGTMNGGGASGAPTSTAGKINQAIEFDGKNGYISVSDVSEN